MYPISVKAQCVYYTKILLFFKTPGVKLLDYSSDKDHNRTVVTIMGEPSAVKKAILEVTGIAIENIDLRKHQGAHPRMGAIDVVPFIPLRDYSMQDAVALARETAQAMAERYDLPVFLYEKAATAPVRENLVNIRKGEFEGLKEKCCNRSGSLTSAPISRIPEPEQALLAWMP